MITINGFKSNFNIHSYKTRMETKVYGPTLLAIIAYSFFLLTVLFARPHQNTDTPKQYTTKDRIVALLLTIPPCLISVISIQCMVSCDKSTACLSVAWYSAFVVSLWSVGMSLLL